MHSRLFLILSIFLCASAGATNLLTPPNGFEVQRLEPLGGEVLKPKGWYFNVTGTKDAAVYQIAKEDPKKGQFETGLTINIIPGIRAKTGEPTTGYIPYFYNKKKKSGRVVSTDPVTQQGKFTRFAFLVDEELTLRGKKNVHRISYCIFASDETDLLIMMIFGCPRDEWPKNELICSTMCERIKLYDEKDNNLPNQSAQTTPGS